MALLPKEVRGQIAYGKQLTVKEAFDSVKKCLIRNEFTVEAEIENEFLNAIRDPVGKGLGASIEINLKVRVIVKFETDSKSIHCTSRYNQFVLFDTGDLKNFHGEIMRDLKKALASASPADSN